MRLLGLLAQMDGSMQSEIAAEAGIRPASLSELIGRLEQTGMVERRQSEIDKRSVHIHLTEAGREAAREAGEMRSQLVDAAFAELDESECSVFADMLEKVLRGLERRNAKRDENLPEAGE
ncbi:MAG: MarR family transcriptional regulator [Planctomycetes bacterium]|nr:MarR family transcriptional regulator [Planctomycetota bacterium]